MSGLVTVSDINSSDTDLSVLVHIDYISSDPDTSDSDSDEPPPFVPVEDTSDDSDDNDDTDEYALYRIPPAMFHKF